MIRLEGVNKYYGEIKVVDDISFEVPEGETLVLLGTSGCGKTTTLKMINRLIELSSGNIFINQINIRDQVPELLRRSIGYVFQNTGLFPHYTIRENIAVVPRLLNWEQQKTDKRTKELLEKLKLDPDQVLSLYPSQLSGGQQQRIGLARALIANPPVLLMDEPFGALDPVTRISIRKEFMNLDELKRKTIILVTHDVLEAFELGDRICLMDKGKIQQVGSPAELLFKPANDFVRSFLDEQRLLLELKSIKLKDLNAGFILKDLPDNLHFWDALSLVTERTDERISITDNDRKIVRIADINDLLKAFTNYRFY